MNMGSTGLSVDPKLWDSKAGMAVGRSKDAIRVNKSLDDMESDLRHIFRKVEYSDGLSLARIKDIYLGDVHVGHPKMYYSKKIKFSAGTPNFKAFAL